jgi:pimeloyl-ACP methyl ester carboxylesterase
VAAESIGSGPAASLAHLCRQPDKFVFIVPFDSLSSVAEDHFPAFLVRLILRTNWDNMKALLNFKGPVDIFGAERDTIIPVKHAKALAAALPGSSLAIIDGGHNEWSFEGRVKIRNP